MEYSHAKYGTAYNLSTTLILLKIKDSFFPDFQIPRKIPQYKTSEMYSEPQMFDWVVHMLLNFYPFELYNQIWSWQMHLALETKHKEYGDAKTKSVKTLREQKSFLKLKSYY